MKVTTTHSAMKVTREFTIAEDGPVVPMAYNRQGKQVRVLRGAIEYTWTPEGWIVQVEHDVHLTCAMLKKDGTDSMNTHTRQPASAPRSWSHPHLVLADGWEWLAEIVELLRPRGDLAMVTLRECEVKV